MEKNINLEHAQEIYQDVVDGNPEITKDIGQLYFAIKLLGDELKHTKETLCSIQSLSQ
jgi:hypothetical protein